MQGSAGHWQTILGSNISFPSRTCIRQISCAHHRQRTGFRDQHKFVCSASAGPAGAFEQGREAATRQRLFNRIAPAYDQLNDVLSLGLHRVWKRTAVKWCGAATGQTVLDVCCGSGDLALRLAQAVGIDGKVVGLDFAQEMLDDAAQRDLKLPAYWDRAPIDWVQGDALALPFDDASFDAATVGYGLRNVADIPRALGELHRALRPGATAAVLDFNNSSEPSTDAFQGWALQQVVVPMARTYGMAEEYEYLRPSIKQFPTGQEQEHLAREAGFETAVHYQLAYGLMGCLVATKR